MTAISGANVSSPNQSAVRNASVVTIVSVMPREKMSCRITFMPRDTAVLMRYKATHGHRAKHDRKRGHHLRIKAQTMAEKADERDRDSREDGALQDAEKNGEAKERAAASAVAGRLGSRNERDDRVVEAEDADLAHEISRGPRDGENAERGRAEKPGHEERENSSKI